MSVSLLRPYFLMSKTRSYAQIIIGSRLFLTAMAIHLSLRVASLRKASKLPTSEPRSENAILSVKQNLFPRFLTPFFSFRTFIGGICRYGFIPFIVSEVMFLFAFFRASSHSSLAPTVEIGGIWPPKGIGVLDPREIPFLNTPILLSSGA